MKKFIINGPNPFEAGVILRTLYYGTGFDDMEVYIDNFRNLPAIVRYSRVPIRILKERVKFDTVDLDPNNTLIIDPNAKKGIKNIDVKNYENIVVDFKNKIEGEKVKVLGVPLKHYEAIAFIYYFFIRKYKEKVEIENKNVDREVIYLARKIVEGIEWFQNHYIIHPRFLTGILRNFHKRYGILVDFYNAKVDISYDGELEMKVLIEFFNKRLEKIGEDYIWIKGRYIEIPIFKRNSIKKVKFYIDWDRRRVYITKNFYVEGEMSQGLEALSFF